MNPDELATKLAEHLITHPMPDQDVIDKIEGEPAVGIGINSELFFATIDSA